MLLHAHLPYVRHAEFDGFLEESWFFEALTECYLPLLEVFDRLVDDGVDFRMTLSLSPPLCEMLCDNHLRAAYRKRLDALCRLTDKELARADGDEAMSNIARFYHERFGRIRHLYEGRYGTDLIAQFRRLQDRGVLELITCTATHGLLPLMEDAGAVRNQIRIARVNYEKHFHRSPRGIWLPECGWRPGLDQVLADEGLRFFFTDAHGILLGEPQPKYGIFAPIRCPGGPAAFGRDHESGKQVWSATEGYPADPVYREYYRDVAYDTELEYLHPFLNGDGIRMDTGLKYHRITGPVELGDKALYDVDAARERAVEHAGNFMFNRQHQARHLNGILGRPPVIVSPYDAELFGHWWYEGPTFLDALLRKIHFDQDEIRTLTPSEYLRDAPPLQAVEPSASSWGDGGYFSVWLNGSNDWIYKHLHAAERRMSALAERGIEGPMGPRATAQARRELLLAQSSDWAFMMTMGTTARYASQRTREHLQHFNALAQQMERGQIDASFLERLEANHKIFPELTDRTAWEPSHR